MKLIEHTVDYNLLFGFLGVDKISTTTGNGKISFILN